MDIPNSQKLFLLLLVLCFILIGCQKNATFKDSITFQGYVHYGILNSSSIIVSLGPQADATVICEGHSEYTKTTSDGSYSLTIGSVRNFGGSNFDNYTLKAFSPNGGEEKATVSGKPGDTIKVKTIILYKYHTEE